MAGTSVQAIRNIGISFGAAASGMVAAAAGLSERVGRDAVAIAMSWVYGVNALFAVLALAMIIPMLVARRQECACGLTNPEATSALPHITDIESRKVCFQGNSGSYLRDRSGPGAARNGPSALPTDIEDRHATCEPRPESPSTAKRARLLETAFVVLFA